MKRLQKVFLKIVGISILTLVIFFATVMIYGYVFGRFISPEENFAKYNKILEKNPDDEWALEKRAAYFYWIGEYGKRDADNKKLFEIYTKRIEENPKDADAYLGRSKLHVHGGLDVIVPKSDYEKEISDLTHYIDLKPGDIKQYYERGYDYYQIDEYDKAIADFTKYIDAPFYLKFKMGNDYHEDMAHYFRNMSYFNSDQYEIAKADYIKYKKLDVNKGESWEYQWIFGQGWENYEKRIEACNRILKHKPDNKEIIGFRADSYEKLKQYDKAIADYNKLIELEPDFAKHYIERARLYQEKGDYNSALSDCEYIINQTEKLSGAYNRRGQIYIAMKEYNKAIDDLNKSIELYEWTEPYIFRGDAYRLLGEDEKALDNYSKAIASQNIYDDDWRVLLDKAKLLEEVGKKDEAIESYKDFILVASHHNYRKLYESEKKFAEERVKLLESI